MRAALRWLSGGRIAPGILGDVAGRRHLREMAESWPTATVIAPENLDHSKVVDWKAWTRPTLGHGRRREAGVLRGADWGGGERRFSERMVPALAELVNIQTREVRVDIRDVVGMAASKSDLHVYQDMDSFAQERCQGLIGEISRAGLDAAMSHRESRIFHNAGDWFDVSGWDGRLFLINAGGSHHFAAARYIAGAIGESVELVGEVHINTLDKQAVKELHQEFVVLALPPLDVGMLLNLEDQLDICRASHYFLDMPRPLNGQRALFLPRSDPRALAAGEALRAAGVVDLGQALAQAVNDQREKLVVLDSMSSFSPKP